MRDRAIGSIRIVFMIIGLILFVVYGLRATSASTTRKIAGTEHSVYAAANLTAAQLLSDNATMTVSYASPVGLVQPSPAGRPNSIRVATAHHSHHKTRPDPATASGGHSVHPPHIAVPVNPKLSSLTEVSMGQMAAPELRSHE